MFERLFEELTDITRKTWNNRVESLVSNAVLHMQAEKTSGGNTAATCIIRQEKEISNMSKGLPKLGNTVLPKDIINTHAGDWEARIKSIADFQRCYVIWKILKKCYEKFKLTLNHLVQVQVLKQYKEINEAIVEWSANFKKVSHKIPTENHMKKDPVIAKTWRKNKVATELLKIWKITVHLPK